MLSVVHYRAYRCSIIHITHSLMYRTSLRAGNVLPVAISSREVSLGERKAQCKQVIACA